MRFLIQKIDGDIRHDFSFTLLESIRFINWLRERNTLDKIIVKFFDTTSEQKKFFFKNCHRDYTPIGSVEFVHAFMEQFYGYSPNPINIPEELMSYYFTKRVVKNGNHMDVEDLSGKWFAKSNDEIKKFADFVSSSKLPPIGDYQFSTFISIDSEWRAFIYDGKLVGLNCYSGEFTLFPNVEVIKEMIKSYKSAPIAYTLDVGVNDKDTFIIECHNFYSCGLYGFSEHNILPSMFNKWFYNFKNNIK
jgi:hypothetical protein